VAGAATEVVFENACRQDDTELPNDADFQYFDTEADFGDAEKAVEDPLPCSTASTPSKTLSGDLQDLDQFDVTDPIDKDYSYSRRRRGTHPKSKRQLFDDVPSLEEPDPASRVSDAAQIDIERMETFRQAPTRRRKAANRKRSNAAFSKIDFSSPVSDKEFSKLFGPSPVSSIKLSKKTLLERESASRRLFRRSEGNAPIFDEERLFNTFALGPTIKSDTRNHARSFLGDYWESDGARQLTRPIVEPPSRWRASLSSSEIDEYRAAPGDDYQEPAVSDEEIEIVVEADADADAEDQDMYYDGIVHQDEVGSTAPDTQGAATQRCRRLTRLHQVPMAILRRGAAPQKSIRFAVKDRRVDVKQMKKDISERCDALQVRPLYR
jgi:hypothetical protein